MVRTIYLVVYPAIGFFVNSALHTYYVENEREEGVRFGIPYNEKAGRYGDEKWGYVGSILIGIVSGMVFHYLLTGLSGGLLVDSGLTESFNPITVFLAFGLVGILVNVSQVVGGSSWTKLALDTGLVTITAFIFLIIHNPASITIWNVFPTYITLTFGLFTVGAKWVDYVTEGASRLKVEHSTESENVSSSLELGQELTTDRPFVPFASLAYYGGSVGYLLIGSLLTLIFMRSVLI